MKAAQIILLVLLISVSATWLMLFAVVPFTFGYGAVDAILPPSLMARSTPAEDKEVVANINKLVSRPLNGWIFPAMAFVLSLASLVLAVLLEVKNRK